MLLSNLDRQGTDLEFTTTGSSLFYLNFTQFQVGVNTSVTSETLTVDGNALISTLRIDNTSTISTTQLNQNITLRANGSGNVVVINANVQSGTINATQIGALTPGSAVFTTANTTARATLNTAKVNNLSPGRLVFTAEDNEQLEDSPTLLYFASNDTLITGNVISTGAVDYPSIVSGNIFLTGIGDPGYVMFLSANLMVSGEGNLQYFSGNSTLSTIDFRLTNGPGRNRIAYKNTSDLLVSSDNLAYDGFTLNSQNITIVNNLRMTGTTVTTTGSGDDIVISPLGAGAVVNFGSHRLIGAVSPVDAGDVATKGYVDGVLGGAEIVTNKIASQLSVDPESGQTTTDLVVYDNSFEEPGNILMRIDGVRQAEFTNGFANIQNFSIYESKISSLSGEIILDPAGQERVRIDSTTSLRIPAGSTGQRPAIGISGDLRVNTDINTLEWHNGFEWTGLIPTAKTQTLVPDGVNVTFTLDYAASPETIIVIINGVVQRPGFSYTVNGDQITFVEVPLTTDVVEIRYLAVAITYASTPLFVNSPYATFGTSYVTVDNWFIAQYRSAQYTYTFKNPANNQFAMGEVYVLHDGFEPHVAVKEYSAGETSYLTWTADVDVFGALTLQVKGSNTGNFIKFRATYFAEDPVVTITWISTGSLGTFSDSITPPSRYSVVIPLQVALSTTGLSPTFTLYSGSLPPGLTLSTNGIISGVANAVVTNTTYNFVVSADAPGALDTLSSTLSITILAP
jgi:hypothetical protein